MQNSKKDAMFAAIFGDACGYYHNPKCAGTTLKTFKRPNRLKRLIAKWLFELEWVGRD